MLFLDWAFSCIIAMRFSIFMWYNVIYVGGFIIHVIEFWGSHIYKISLAADNVTQLVASARSHVKTTMLVFLGNPFLNQTVNPLNFECKCSSLIWAFFCIIVIWYSVLTAINGVISYSIVRHYYLRMYLSMS